MPVRVYEEREFPVVMPSKKMRTNKAGKVHEKITTYDQAFALIGLPMTDKARGIVKELEQDGHTEKSISFAVWRSRYTLLELAHKSKFWSVFHNEVLKWSWPRGDPRWDDYWKKKKEGKKADKVSKQTKIKETQEVAYKKRYPGFIYIVQGESGGPIKIGYTKELRTRLSSLQSGYPEVLMLLHSMPGSTEDEQMIHRELKGSHLRGEWFKPSEQTLNFIEKSKQG